MSAQTPVVDGVAIIGMSGRFPGASNVGEFWRNQLEGIESISQFQIDELEIPNKADIAGDPRYVLARSVLPDVDLFDAEFFGINPREAELMDPQQRLFLECCWQAIEDAGYVPETYPGQIGVYAGSSIWSYFLTRLCTKPGFIQKFTSGYQVSNYFEMMGNSLDFLSTRVSYKLNLRGPSCTLLSACSTSLLAVTEACQSLLTYQSDMALAGGVSITFPQKRGYFFQDGGMVSPDGHCRAFDADAQGTVFGSGVAVVLLKRVDEAIRDGDQIYAVIRGFAVNNDGSAKVGYTAPSVEGQASVIAMAHEAAGVDPESIGYIEAHGTGTPLGDPIELTGLTQAFRARTNKKQFCTIGTAKTNVGHLDVAAGVTGLINAAHIVRYGIFPPTLHFKKANPNFDLDNSPFRVNSKRSEWKTQEAPRRAGVSSFGVGGTNAHVVLEQGPEEQPSPSTRPCHLLVISARSPAALDQAADNLAAHLKLRPEMNLADVAWTLQAGRRAFDCRRAVTARDVSGAIRALSSKDDRARLQASQPKEASEVYFLFPGQGSQYPNMAREIYQAEAVFRDAVDRCAEILRPHLDVDLRTLLYPSVDPGEEDKRRVKETAIAQPAIFTVEYALAQLWMSWGIRPKAMAGHSIGEFVAACLAGVLSLEDALTVVALRGRMMQQIPPGGMLSVRMPESDLRKRLSEPLSLAAVNSPSLCVVAGATEPLERFERELVSAGVACRRLVTSHAFHSAMMDPMIDPLADALSQIRFEPPQIPYVSGVTGTWITADEATDPRYWARHAREPVQFSEAVKELRKNPHATLLEVGPGNALATLARQHQGFSTDQVIISSLSDGFSGEGDYESLMTALGALWRAGAKPDWSALYKDEHRLRVSLPTYPFQRKRYWLDVAEELAPNTIAAAPATRLEPQIVKSESPLNLGADVVNVMSSSPSIPQQTAPTPGRAAQIRAALVEMFGELSGMDLAEADGSTTFIEMGFDSLFLTQAAQGLQEKFGVKITFRQLLNDVSSLDALSNYLDGKLSPQAFAEPARIETPSTPILPPAATQVLTAAVQTIKSPGMLAGPAIAGESPVERLLREQLQAMNQLFAKQLEVLSGATPGPSGPATPSSLAASAVSALAPPVNAASPAKTVKPDGEEIKAFGPYKPPQTSASKELTEHQKKCLDLLIDRFTRRTRKSKTFTQDHRKVLADPRVVSGFRPQWKEMIYSIVAERSEGSRIWDLDGNEYIDLVNGFGPIMLGHRPAFVEQAIAKQLREGIETGPQTPLAGEVAKLFCEMTGNERMTFCNTGSEAVLAALRVSRTVTGRSKVVMFAGDYHGMFDEVLVKGFKNKAGEVQTAPIAPGIPRQSVSNMVVLDYGTEQSLAWIRQNSQEIAAVLVEPVQSRHPGLRPIEFLREIRKITEESGAALIFDEVVTGFRAHPAGCQELFGIRADLATYGKVVAGGMPIGILAGKAAFMDALDGGMWQYGDDSIPEVGVTFFAGTFVRHPLVVAATKAVLQHFKEQGPALQERLNERTTRLVARLNEIFEQHQIPSRIETFSSFFYFGFPSEERFASLFYFYLRDKGIHVREGFPCFLTTAHTDADFDKIVQAFKDSAIEMREGGFFSGSISELPEKVPLAPVDADPGSPREAPITEPQLEIWLSDQLSDEASCSYNKSFSLHLHGNFDEELFKRSLRYAVGRHDCLGATFDGEGGIQRLARPLHIEIPAVDLSSLTPEDRDARLQQIIADDAGTPFRLSEGPLVRMQLIRMDSSHHVFIFTAHHIVCDGWSANVLLDEISTAYNAMKAGAACELPRPPSFAAYAQAQAEFVQSAEGIKNESYWLDKFKQLPPLLDLPTDRPRPAMKEFKGATYRHKLDAAAYNRIKTAGAKHKCTLFVTLLAGFEILLSRLSGQDDVVVGIPTAGQSLLDDGSLVGHCVNFIPLRDRVTGNMTAGQFLAQVKQTVLAGYEHQNYTYGRLVRKLALQRDPSRLPLMEVQFNLERFGEGLSFDGLTAEVDSNPKRFVNFDIFLNIVESKNGLILDCDYNAGLFDEATIARWLDHYEVLLEGIAADAAQLVSRLPLLAVTERERMLLAWNETKADLPAEALIHRLIEMKTKEAPDAIAVEFEGERLTYAELDWRSNQVAHYLRKLGVGPGVLVGVFMERGLEMIIGLLGTLKAGGAYVPMDPTFPPERLRFVLDDAKVPVVLTLAALTRTWSFGSAQVVLLDGDRTKIDREVTSKPPETALPDGLAYVIYTSGSTGRPKGVEIQHRAVVNFLQSMAVKPGLTQSDVLAAVTTLSFDIAGLELYLPLCTGAKLVIVSRETAQYGVRLLEYLKKVGATVVQATPVTWKQLLDVGWSGDPALKVLCGGEAWPRELAEQLVPRSKEVWNMYGPTETTIWSAVSRVEAGDGSVCIGHPIANTEFYVLDTNRELSPIGVAGELCIAGQGLARGYLNRAELTNEKFVSNPFSREPGARMYRTGDLVRRRPDGMLEFLSRLDDQIKLRGFRIELGEIESVLASHPGIADAAVCLREDVPGEKRLVGYLVAAAGSSPPSAADLRSFLLTRLPDYMAPAAYVTLDALPLTPNGKVDRRALPAPDWTKGSRTTPYEAPATDEERTMAGIWENVLRVEQVGRNDNLFELGADSLHVFQIAARAGKAGISVTPRQIFQYRTISAIFAQMAKTAEPKARTPAIKPVAREKFRLRPQVAS